MPYCTADHVIRSVSADVLADMLGVAPGDLSADINIADAIVDAGSRIDSYLSQAGYALPVVVDAPSLRRAAVDMTVYYLFQLRRAGDVEDYLKRYSEHVAWLQRVADGRARIPELETAGDSSTGDVMVIAPAPSVAWGAY